MFDKYCAKIKNLNSYDKEAILNEAFEIYREKNMKIYYAPHNETINEDAKIFIVGITPGWTQTSLAYKTAHEGLVQNIKPELIQKECKRNSRFAGSMRSNLIEMLDELTLNRYLHLDSCSQLFGLADNLLHTTSIIPYPVFINNKNYTGSNPKIMDNEVLYSYVKKYFYQEIEKLPNALIIPLGKAVEEVLEQMVKDNLIKEGQCLFGFPHPSGANGHRRKQFKENKTKLLKKIDSYFRSV